MVHTRFQAGFFHNRPVVSVVLPLELALEVGAGRHSSHPSRSSRTASLRRADLLAANSAARHCKRWEALPYRALHYWPK